MVGHPPFWSYGGPPLQFDREEEIGSETSQGLFYDSFKVVANVGAQKNSCSTVQDCTASRHDCTARN